MRESVPDFLLYDKIAREVFSILITKYEYELIESITQVNYTKYTYKNKRFLKRRIVIIENQTSAVDYGFSFSILNPYKKQQYRLYTIPWEKQDLNCNFLTRVKDYIFENETLQKLISGKIWNLNEILSVSE